MEWENSGCLSEIRNNGGQEIDVFIDVTKDLDNLLLASEEGRQFKAIS